MSHDQKKVHMLSFDVEEYFQVEAASEGVPQDQWDDIPSRLPSAVDTILQLLDEHGATATFFILGWVAQKNPALIRRIFDAGHEIASHGMGHRMITRLSPDEFHADVSRSRELLQDITGKEVIGYRAPTFSVTHQTSWALDVLTECGYRYDSSVFPVHHDRYGVPDAPVFPHKAVGPLGGKIIEIPPLTMRIPGTNLPVGGGGYLRLFPVRLVARALRRVQRKNRPGMIYLHPWEFDPDQPVLPMNRLSRWRHRVGLRRTRSKLDWLMKRFAFGSVEQQLERMATEELEEYNYGRDATA